MPQSIMENPKTPDIGESFPFEGLYWASSEGESSTSDSAPSSSSCESPASSVSEQEDPLPIKEQTPEKHEEVEEYSEPSVFRGRGVASPEIPQPISEFPPQPPRNSRSNHPAAPSQRVTRYIPDSSTPICIRTPLLTVSPLLSHPSPSTHRAQYRRVTFDRVLDLSIIQARTRDSPKPRFAENGDIASPPTRSSPIDSPSPGWQSRFSTPGNKMPLRAKSDAIGRNGDFMQSEGGLGLRAASWGL